jgi:anti-sigma regulatory factor (Ser/Thr protein kinase)/anti-anti-sigma regulatory factor
VREASRDGREAAVTLRVTRTNQADCIVLHVTGRLDTATAVTVRRALHKALAEQPRAVVCDLAGMQVDEPAALTVFLTVARREPYWPTVPVSLCAAGPSTAEWLHRLSIDTRLAVRGTLPEALAAPDRAPYRHQVVPLPQFPQSARTARDFVQDYYTGDDDELAATLTLIASELVTNAVCYGASPITLYLSQRAERVLIGVADANPDPPRLLALSPMQPGGRGMHLLDALTQRWGLLTPATGGKLVWALLVGSAAAGAVEGAPGR